MWISQWRRRATQRLSQFQFRRLASGESIKFTAGQLYGLPSSEGMIFVIMAMVMLLTASTYSNNLMFAVSFLAGAIFLVLPSFVYRNLRSCSFDCSGVAPVFLGEKAQCKLRVSCAHTAWGLRVHVDGGDNEHLDRVVHNASLQLSFTPPRRGLQDFPPVRIASAYPMNLFNLWGWMKGPAGLLVYPKPDGVPLDNFFRLNNRRAVLSADSELQYWQHRPFQPGDNYSRVDWVKLATMGKMYVREYRPVSDATVYFDFASTRMPCTGPEERLSQLCLWIVQAEAAGLRYGLTIANTQLPVENGKAHRHLCLEALARYPSASANPRSL
ncbi:MAG: DUF58 domain-containing protein [Proteobacteria bacterium]|nr:DUF58 domain-containing protein [Pseudomonadota bacterium]